MAETPVEAVEQTSAPERRRPDVFAILAAVLLAGALLLPSDPHLLGMSGFVALPLEALVLAALVVILPARASRITAAAAGLLLGVLTVLKALDLGFGIALARRFNPVSDWPLLGAGRGVPRLLDRQPGCGGDRCRPGLPGPRRAGRDGVVGAAAGAGAGPTSPRCLARGGCRHRRLGRVRCRGRARRTRVTGGRLADRPGSPTTT